MSQFQLSINIKDMKTQDLVAYKIDGQRFGTSAKTMKFFTGDIYELTVCAKPVQQLLRLVIGGKEVPLKQKPGDSGTFIGQWTAHIPPQRNGKREDIHFSIVGKFGALSTVWQCKFYNSADEHGGWGDKLTGLYYTCSLVEGGFRITDEQYH